MNHAIRTAKSRKPDLTLSLIGILFSLACMIIGIRVFHDAQLGVNRDFVYAVAWLYVAIVVLSLVFKARGLLRSRRIALLVFLIGHFAWFAWPLYKALTGQIRWFGDRKYYLPVSDDNVLFAILYISSFLALVVTTYSLASHWLQLRIKTDAMTNVQEFYLDKKKTLHICLALFLLGVLPMLVFGGGIGDILTNILASRGGDKGWGQRAFESNPLNVVGRASMVSAGAVSLGMLFIAKKQFFKVAFFLIFFLAFSITYFDSGTRTWSLLIVLPFLLVKLTQVHGRRAVSARKLLFLAILAAALLGLLGQQVLLRNSGFFQANNNTSTGPIEPDTDDNNFFLEMAITLSAFPEHFDFIDESTLVLFITNLIPRSMWEGKPYSEVVRTYSLARDGWDIYVIRGVSRMPSVVGQYYIIWGESGVVLISFFYGTLLAWIDSQWRQKHTTLFYLWLGILATWTLVSFRGMFPGFHYPILIVGLILLFLRRSIISRPGRYVT